MTAVIANAVFLTAALAWTCAIPVLTASRAVRVGARGNGSSSGVRRRPRPTPPPS